MRGLTVAFYTVIGLHDLKDCMSEIPSGGMNRLPGQILVSNASHLDRDDERSRDGVLSLIISWWGKEIKTRRGGAEEMKRWEPGGHIPYYLVSRSL